ncbi:MAG: hypothetical protein J7494_12105 [Sphingobium sp.]|nr:hypothetical protein [Sphingobium sp.]
MRKSILGLSAVSLIALATPAFAEDAPASDGIKITGNVALVSDYRFRGVSQNGQDAAVQGGITVTADNGFYVGTWASSINFAGHTEVDLFAGYSKEVAPGVTADVGVLYYLYPKHGAGDTDFFEPYVNVTVAVGPATIKAGANYAWAQSALADLKTGAGDSDSLYLHLEPSVAVPGTPLGFNAHVGYASSRSFMANPTLDYSNTKGDTWDWSVGATATYKMLTFGVSYVDTDIKPAARGVDGGIVFSLTAAF